MQILHRGIFMPAFDRILQLARMEEMDCEFVEVTAHEGARPTHAVWQGRVYHRGGINKMRRVNYAANKERINAQKRAAYAARRLREQADRGILDGITGGYLPVTEQSIEAVQPFTCRVLDEAGQISSRRTA